MTKLTSAMYTIIIDIFHKYQICIYVTVKDRNCLNSTFPGDC